MLDLNFKITVEKDNLNNHFTQKTSNKKKDAFSKVFEDANKSFEATKEKISENDNKEEGFFQKLKDKYAEKKEEPIKNETSSTKDDFQDTEENEELNPAENASALEQILLNYKNTLTNNLPQEGQEGIKNSQTLREVGERLLHQKEQALELTVKFMEEMKNIHTKSATQNPIKPLTQLTPQEAAQIQGGQTNGILLSTEALLNLQNLQNSLNQKVDGNSTLADAMAELKVEVTSIKTDVQTESNSFNFNSSSFNNLNSHLTKLSLNKGVDFSKVMGEKNLQEQQILNQVKEATTSQISKGTSQVNIILRPESLGRVNVHISSANGAVTAQFTAQSQQAADALSKNIETLRQSLVEQGVKVTDVTVKVQSSSQGEGLADNRNFNEGNFTNSKENYSSNKNSFGTENNSKDNGHNNSGKEEETSAVNNSNIKNEMEEEEIVSSSAKNNNDLGIYNNMGRKV